MSNYISVPGFGIETFQVLLLLVNQEKYFAFLNFIFPILLSMKALQIAVSIKDTVRHSQ